MAFSEDNQKWILDRINEAVYPNGLKKIAGWLRYWSLLAVVVATLLSLVGIVVTLAIYAMNLTAQNSEFRGKTEARLTAIALSPLR